MTKPLRFLAVLLLAACDDERAPAPSAAEAEQLDEVEAMLNDATPKQEGSAPQGADPSNRSD